MNRLRSIVTHIENEGHLHLVSFDFLGKSLKMMGLELPVGLKEGSCVVLGVKPFSVAIGKNFQGEISYSNQLDTTISKLEWGKILCSVTVDFNGSVLQSFITNSSAKRLGLEVGDNVKLFIKASDLFVAEVCDA